MSTSANYGSAALLDHLARISRTRAESRLKRFGLRPRHFMALTLLRDGEGLSQQALASALEMDRSNLVGLLNDLEGRDLVSRTRSPTDRRRHVVRMTPAGTRTLDEVEAALSSIEDEVLVGLDEGDRKTLYRLLERASSRHVADCSHAQREWAAGTTG